MAKRNAMEEMLLQLARDMHAVARSEAASAVQQGRLHGPAWMNVGRTLERVIDTLDPPPPVDVEALSIGRAALGEDADRDTAIAMGMRVLTSRGERGASPPAPVVPGKPS